MKLELQRDIFSSISVEGRLFLDGKDLYGWVTLERPDLNNQQGISCIPAGLYDIELKYSPHFKRIMPHLINVPNREGILIHWANWPKQLEGCIAVGHQRSADAISDSVKAFNELFTMMQSADDAQEHIQILITEVKK